MHPDLEKLVSRGKLDPAAAEKLDALEPGTFCAHKSWGAGKVVDWDRLNTKVVVDFEDKPGHEMGMKFAASSLTPLAEDSFLAMRHSKLEELQALAAGEPVDCVKLALQSTGGKIYLDDLEDLIKGRVIPEGKYKSWWEGTKRRLREDRQFIVPSKRTEPLEMRDEEFDHSDHLINDFREARDLKAKLKAVEAIVKDLGIYEDPVTSLGSVLEEIGEVAKKGVKLQFVPAVELILARDELANRIKGFELGDDQINVAEILQTETERIAELLEELSLTRLRQVLRNFPAAFGDEWPDQILALIPESNLRTIGEIADYLDQEGRTSRVVEWFELGLQQRTLSSDALAWICRERKKLAEPVFDEHTSLAVMSSLESDQLNDEGLVRSANRLRDLIVDDKELIPDLIEGANINTIRNFAGRLANSASFDELTRKSLMARVIKLQPETLDLVAGREEEEEVLIVSEESLARKKADYDRLVKEEIPQNREDIKIARSYGDLRENFEYKSAKEYQRVLMKRQNDWQRDLKIASPTDFSNADTSMVSIGTIVELEPVEGGDPLTYTILGAWDSDPEQNVLAYLSGRGAQMLEKKPGDLVEFSDGSGESEQFRIKEIRPYKT